MSKPIYNIGGTSQGEFGIRVGQDGVGELRLIHDGVDAAIRNDTGVLYLKGGANIGLSVAADGTVDLAGPLKADGDEGISGQVLSSQGPGLPGIWRTASGGAIELGYNFNNTTASANPGAQKLGYNDTTFTGTTVVRFNITAFTNFDASTILSLLQDGNRIYMQQRNDASKAVVFQVTGTGTNMTGWWTIPVLHINSRGTPFPNNADLNCVFILSAAAATPLADPTGTVGLTAVNGVAISAMRSDAAPPLSQAIVPTWSALHTFSLTPVVPNDSWTYAKIQNVSATSRVLGRITTGAGDIEELTGANLVTIIGSGIPAAASPTGTVGLTVVNGSALTWMRSDAAPPLSQAIVPTWSAQHTFSLTPVVPNDSWTYAKIQNVSATSRVLGRITAGAGDIEELTGANLTTIIGGAALTKTDDTNVTLTLGGTPATALLVAASLTLGWTGTLGVARGGTNLASYAIGDLIYASAATTLARLADVATGNALISGGVTTAPSWGKIGLTTHVSGTLPVANGGTNVTALGDLTRVNDTNVTLTLGGTPTGALITSASMTLGWTGTLAVARGGSGIGTLTGYLKGNGTSAFSAVATIPYSDITGGPSAVTPAALTKTDDTNVTLTLGGTPATALLQASSLTLGWTGTLAVARGGSGAGTLTGYLKGNGTSAFTAVATIPYADLTGTPTIPVAANPTGTVDLTAVNGSAVTFLRSDGAPALSQAIIPTWTGQHTFTDVVTLFSAANVQLRMNETDQAADEKMWMAQVVAKVWAVRTATDAGGTGGNAIAVNRGTGVAIASIEFGNTSHNNTFSFLGTGAGTVSGTWTFNLTPVVPNDSWTYAKIQNVSATSRVLGRITTGAGDIEELTGANLATIIGTSLGANPSASVGLTAVNGSAATYMRSDGAPALSQAIVPTWSGQHTFADVLTVLTNDSGPILRFIDSNAATDIKNWRIRNTTGSFQVTAETDATAVQGNALDFLKTAAGITTMSFGNATNNPAYNFLGTGLVAINGQASIGDGSSNGDRLRLRNSSAPAVSTNYHHYFNIASNTQLYLYGWDGTNATIGTFRIGHPQVFFADGTAANPVIAFNSDQDNGLYYIGTNNWGASAGGAKVMEWLAAASGAAKVADTGGTMQPVGFRNVPVSSTTTTLAIGDVGKCIDITATINIPISVFAAGDTVSLYNNSSGSLNITISAGTLRKSGTATTGTLALLQRGMVTLWFRVGGATPEVIAMGDV